MFERFGTGLRLAKASWQVLKQDRSLVVFPIISAISAIIAIALVLSPWWLGFDAGSATGGVGTTEGDTGSPLLWGLLLAAGYVATAISIFFNVALASCAARSLNGEDTKVGEGIAAASARLPQILGWAVIAFVVGLILRALDEIADEAPFPLSIIANIGVAIIGMAWSAVTFLVIPVLALEDVGPGEALSRSKRLIIQKWGEGLAGNVGIGFAVFLLTGLPGILLLLLGSSLIESSAPAGWAMHAIGGALLVVGGIVGSTLNQVFAVALHRYASTGEMAPGFAPSDMTSAFRQRKQR
ncbi:MAG: conserved hypothetical rane protein [Thermoleophilia bacterium]|nr:conserved hypothetical rane protein [Thermoleophilia bacterium]